LLRSGHWHVAHHHLNSSVYTQAPNDVIYGDYDLSERLNAASGLGDEDFADLKTGEIYVSFQILCAQGTRVE